MPICCLEWGWILAGSGGWSLAGSGGSGELKVSVKSYSRWSTHNGAELRKT